MRYRRVMARSNIVRKRRITGYRSLKTELIAEAILREAHEKSKTRAEDNLDNELGDVHDILTSRKQNHLPKGEHGAHRELERRRLKNKRIEGLGKVLDRTSWLYLSLVILRSWELTIARKPKPNLSQTRLLEVWHKFGDLVTGMGESGSISTAIKAFYTDGSARS